MNPNLFIVGAAKCGTTTVAHWLSRHPEIHFSPIKEPHYFYPYDGRKQDLRAYESLFKCNQELVKYRAEGSVYYMTSPEALRSIKAKYPDAKCLVCLRNPVEQVVSLYYQKRNTGNEVAKTFEEAWRLSELREQGTYARLIGKNLYTENWSYKKVGRLGEQIKSVLEIFGKANIHFVFLDDIKASPNHVWNSILEFLDVKKIELEDATNRNPATVPKSLFLQKLRFVLAKLKSRFGIRKNFGVNSFLGKINTTASYEKPTQEMVHELTSHFQKDIEIIEKLTNRDLSSWKNNRS